jgi:hypothetical protein
MPGILSDNGSRSWARSIAVRNVESTRGRHGEFALVTETGGVGFVGGEHFLQERSHGEIPPWKLSVAVSHSASKLEF